ncbi:MAG: metalloregulator ArsR/SmtB family transcription factor [Bacteriovorax sp.]|nr:metalloregulator ArsR/SmtB family transcription factor [Bacteriovorax sp.]
MLDVNSNIMAVYEMQANICHALSHPIRLYILDILSTEEMSSTQLLKELGIPKANLSQHLSVLKDAGILKTRKVGAFQILTLAIPKIKDACQLVRGILLDRMNDEQKVINVLKKKLDIQVKKNAKQLVKKTIVKIIAKKVSK